MKGTIKAFEWLDYVAQITAAVLVDHKKELVSLRKVVDRHEKALQKQAEHIIELENNC